SFAVYRQEPPADFAFIDGQISEELFKEEHELAYEEMKEQTARAEANTEERVPDQDALDGLGS
ncbi:MAG: hypothetical protein ACMG6H_04500, partial [Acidobacteriota bacterium]